MKDRVKKVNGIHEEIGSLTEKWKLKRKKKKLKMPLSEVKEFTWWPQLKTVEAEVAWRRANRNYSN